MRYYRICSLWSYAILLRAINVVLIGSWEAEELVQEITFKEANSDNVKVSFPDTSIKSPLQPCKPTLLGCTQLKFQIFLSLWPVVGGNSTLLRHKKIFSSVASVYCSLCIVICNQSFIKCIKYNYSSQEKKNTHFCNPNLEVACTS